MISFKRADDSVSVWPNFKRTSELWLIIICSFKQWTTYLPLIRCIFPFLQEKVRLQGRRRGKCQQCQPLPLNRTLLWSPATMLGQTFPGVKTGRQKKKLKWHSVDRKKRHSSFHPSQDNEGAITSVQTQALMNQATPYLLQCRGLLAGGTHIVSLIMGSCIGPLLIWCLPQPLPWPAILTQLNFAPCSWRHPVRGCHTSVRSSSSPVISPLSESERPSSVVLSKDSSLKCILPTR